MNQEKILIGSMLWVVPGEPLDELERDIREMVENHLSVARLFVLPATVLNAAGAYDFSIWDHTFALAARYGLQLTVTLSSLTVPQGNTLADYEAEREKLKAVNRAIVERYAAAPALHSWILQNEPNLSVTPNPVTLALFRRWLPVHGYHGDIRAIKARYLHGGIFRSIPTEITEAEIDPALMEAYEPVAEQIGTVHPDGTVTLPGVNDGGRGYYPPAVDWGRFTAYMLDMQLREMGDLVHELDALHPTSINPDNIAQAHPAQGGRNLYQEGKTVDFLGCSCHPSWHSTRFSPERITDSVAMFSDMTRSATADPDGTFWISELQAGTNFFSGSRPLCPSARDITHWLWTAIGSGCRGVVYWLFKARPTGFEGLEWGLMNQQGKPSRRSRASVQVAGVLEENGGLFSATRPDANDVWIMHSFDSIDLASRETNPGQHPSTDLNDPRNAALVQDALCGAYLMCRDQDWRAGFVWEYDLSRLPQKGVLLAPNTYALSPEVLAGLAQWVENGGTLIADGLFGAKDFHGYRPGEAAAAALNRLMGHPADDWYVDLKTRSLSLGQGKTLPAWYLTANWENEDGLEVLARDGDGYAAAIRHRAGLGQVIMIGTLFFQSYFAGIADETACEWLASLVSIRKPYRLTHPTRRLSLQILNGSRQDVLILVNHGEACEPEVSFPSGRYLDLLSKESFFDPQRLSFAPGQVRVLAHERNA